MSRVLKGVALGFACLFAVSIPVLMLLIPGYDILDRFEVIKVVTDPRSKQHAVIADYRHAETGRRVIAIWIETGAPPAVGSTEPRHGSPAAIWTGAAEVLNVVWDSDRLRISGPKSTQTARDQLPCLADWLPETAQLCVLPDAMVISIEEPQGKQP